MKKNHVIRAWRDADYYLGLSEEERRALPASPAEVMEVEDEVLTSVSGGNTFLADCFTSGLCTPCPPLHCSA